MGRRESTNKVNYQELEGPSDDEFVCKCLSILSFPLQCWSLCKILRVIWVNSQSLLVFNLTARLLEFFLNVFTEFSESRDKNICHYSNRTRTCHFLWKRLGSYHSVNRTHVTDKIFKLSPIQASMIYQIPKIRWIQWKFCSI